MAKSPQQTFADDANNLLAMREILAFAKERLGSDAKAFTVANVLFGASLKAIEEADGPRACQIFAQHALAVVIEGESDGADH